MFLVTFLTKKKKKLIMLFHFEFIINHDYYAIFLQAQEL